MRPCRIPPDYICGIALVGWLGTLGDDLHSFGRTFTKNGKTGGTDLVHAPVLTKSTYSFELEGDQVASQVQSKVQFKYQKVWFFTEPNRNFESKRVRRLVPLKIQRRGQARDAVASGCSEGSVAAGIEQRSQKRHCPKAKDASSTAAKSARSCLPRRRAPATHCRASGGSWRCQQGSA